MKVCLIGCGKAGVLHLERWALLNYDIIIVDDRVLKMGFPAYLRIDDIPPHIISEIDIWDICTPTSSHLKCIMDILSYNDNANILVEKPLCDTDQIEQLEKYVAKKKQSSGFKIIVNDPYNFSNPIHHNIKFIKQNYSQDDITDIYIEFSKNRSADEEKGRFIDKKSGALGYEWFHMLSILNLFLQKDEMREYLKSSIYSHPFSFTMNRNGVPDNIEEKIVLSSSKKITLYTSMQGLIKYPLSNFYAKDTLPSYLMDGVCKQYIDYGDDRKYRIIHLILKKARISIVLGYTGYNPNEHLVLYKDKDSIETYFLFQDHMLDSIKHSSDFFNNTSKNKNDSLRKALEFETKIQKITNFIYDMTNFERNLGYGTSLKTKGYAGKTLDLCAHA